MTDRAERCPFCGCPGEEFDGHVCEERQVGERLSEQAGGLFKTRDEMDASHRLAYDLGYAAAVRQLAEAERDLRREWWINHGHEYPVLYGDDGELQCTACPADFKRQPIEELRRIVFVARATRGIAPDPPASPAEGSEAACPNCDHGTDPKTLTTCNECDGTGRAPSPAEGSEAATDVEA